MADNERIPRPLFGQVAVMANYCTQQQIDECLKIQTKGKAEGTHFYLGTILINKGFLTLEQALKILKYQKVQIVEDPSNTNKYNVHDFSTNKKYRSPESQEFLKIPQDLDSISVRGDMGLKKITHESEDTKAQSGTLFDIENQSYETTMGGTAVDITSLNLEIDSRATSAKAISFDEVQSQVDDEGTIDPFGGEEFADDLFGDSMEEFRDAEPVFNDQDPFGGESDDPFASSVDMFNEAEEAEQPKADGNSKFPKHMNSSFYVSGAEDIEAREDDEGWSAWEDGEEPAPEKQHVERTLDGPVMAELSSEEKAFSEDFDLEDGATLMDTDAGVAMGAELRDMVDKENLNLGETEATSFEDAANLMEVEGSRLDFGDELFDELQDDAADLSFDEDPFANVSEGDFASGFDGDMSEDPFATAADEDYPETIQDESVDDVFGEEKEFDLEEKDEAETFEQWIESEEQEDEVPTMGGLEGDIEDEQPWDDAPDHIEEFETEQPGIKDDIFAQQFDSEEDEEVPVLGEEYELQEISDQPTQGDQTKIDKMHTLELFTPQGELRESVREELLRETDIKEEEESQLRKIRTENGDEIFGELIDDDEVAVGALEGDIAQTEGALGGDIAQAEGELEGDVLELTPEGTAELIESEPISIDPIARQLKKKRRKDVDYIDDYSLEEITSLDQEREDSYVKEEKTDVDIEYVREEHTDLDIKRPSGWRSLFYGRKATDSKAHVNLFYLLFFFIGFGINVGAVYLLSDFIYGEGKYLSTIICFFNSDYKLEESKIPDEVWTELETARAYKEDFDFINSITTLQDAAKKFPEYKAIYQSERAVVLNLQTKTEQNMGDEYNAAIARTKDIKGIREALSNTNQFIEKYSEKPFSNISKSEDYIKNAQEELARIETELKNETIPKEPELVNMLRSVVAWVPEDSLEDEEQFEVEYQNHNATLKSITSEALPFWKENKPEVYKRVYTKFKIASDFFEKLLILCELLIKQKNSADLDIKSIWQAIEDVKASEKIAREYEEFDSVINTAWIEKKKQEINDEYVDKVFANLQNSYTEAKELTEIQYKLKIKLLNELNESIAIALTLNLKSNIRDSIKKMESEVANLLKDLIRFSNYTEWRAEALLNLDEGNIDEALEYFEKIYPFKEDENPEEIKEAYQKCQFMVVKRDAPLAFETAAEYNAYLNEHTTEELMNAWDESFKKYEKMFELLFDEEGNLIEYTYDDNKLSGFDVVNECIENKLISEALKYLWAGQYQFEIGHSENNYEIFKSAKENYQKALPYFASHFESYQKQVNEIETLIIKCEFDPLKLESRQLQEKAIILLEMDERDKAEEALRMAEHSDELWHDVLTIQRDNEFEEFYNRDINELTKIANLIADIQRAIRRHIYNEKLAEAMMYEQNEDFDRAISVLKNAKVYTSDLRWINKYTKKLQVKKLLKEAKTLADKEDADYPGAISLLDNAAKVDPLERDIYLLKNKYKYMIAKAEMIKNNSAEMSLIKGGTTILMNGNEVEFKDYYIDKHEVTNAEYENFLEFLKSIDNDDSMFRHPDQPTDIEGQTGTGIRSHVPKCWGFPGYNDPNQPVVGVTFWDAYAFAKWAGKRLPTSTEWEYASAGKQRRLYAWGNEAQIDNALCAELAQKLNRSYPMLVNSLLGGAVIDTEILHMIGNVREWTAKSDLETDKVLVMGGSYRTPISEMTNEKSVMKSLSSWDDETGFRCVMDK